MKKNIILILAALFLSVCSINAYAAGGFINVGDNCAETLFTGSVSSHYLLLSSAGVVSAWGDNRYGQCGAEPCDEITEINYIEFENKIVKVVAGNDFSIALDENNVAWGWGNNRRFQLGISRPTDMSGMPTYFTKPEKIEENIIDIAAGENFSILLNEDGEVLFSGLGNNHTLKEFNLPQNGTAKPKIQFINANYDNAIAVDTNFVYYWKSDMNSADVIELSQVDEIVSAAIGKEHFVLECKREGETVIYCFGNNSAYQLGVEDDSLTEALIESLIIPEDEAQNIAVFAGEYNTIVNAWDYLGGNNLMKEYAWGTDCYCFDFNYTEISKEVFSQPMRSNVDYQMIALGDEGSIAFDFVNNSIIQFGNDEAVTVIPLIAPAEDIQTMYEHEYEEIEFHTYNVNFIKLHEDAFPEDRDNYLYWEFVNEHEFRVKVKNFITALGHSSFSPSISVIKLKKNATGENRVVGTYGASLWSFNRKDEKFEVENAEINQDNINGYVFSVTASVNENGKTRELNIPEDIPLFYESPGEINENTHLGLYLYGLPDGIETTVTNIDGNVFWVELTCKHRIDLDFDAHISVCYVYIMGDPDAKGVVGDYDLNSVIMCATERELKGVVISATENTPEILTLESDSITAGKESGSIITAILSGGVFSDKLDAQNWSIYGADGVGIESVKRIDDVTAQVILSGKSVDKYTEKTVKVSCEGTEYADSRNEDGGLTQLQSSNAVAIEKQKKSSGGSSRPSSYVVEFNTNGGTEIENVQIERNGLVTAPKVPVREGFVFKGWYANAELTDEYDFAQKVTESFTLYAAWEEDDSNKIILTVGKKEAIVFGKKVTNDVAPLIKNDRVMLPIRFVAENLGANVSWNKEAPNEVQITKGDKEIVIYMGEGHATVNGEEVTLDTAAFLENDRTYLPIRFLAESLGCKVEWTHETKTVVITKV